MRTPLLLAVAVLAAAPALAAAGRSAGEICFSAGFRPGTAAFTSCVMRMDGDDPLAALDDAKASPETVPDGAPPAPKHDADGRVVAGVKLPPSTERKPPPLQGNIVINGEVISSAPPPATPPPASSPSAFPPIAQPTMPVITVPNWSWDGTGMQ
ncbi:MAG: hypothetical protein HYU60_04975 [Magnetospirillum sp.]|nr:hypothetical protein [Magnetospirillum sp.]